MVPSFFGYNWERESKMQSLKDTIAAISTPLGMGGVGIIRISGPEAIEVGKNIFRPKRKDLMKNRRMSYGEVVRKNGDVIDQALGVYIRSPYTYTGDDTFEIQAHGGNIVLEEIMKECLENGARQAEPGEFTYRSFMNGKMDLMQAEGIVELVNAKSREGAKIAVKQIIGKINDRIRKIIEELINIQVEIESEIEFSVGKDIFKEYELYERKIKDIDNTISEVLEEAEIGEKIKRGIRIVLAGKVNAGKSSLMNALCNHQRAITSDIPGTTRDYIEEEIEINGVRIILVDTAGLRELDEEEGIIIEKEGQKITKELIEEAEYVIYVVDNAVKIENDEIENINKIEKSKAIIAINKTDKVTKKDLDKLLLKFDRVYVSAKNGKGMDELKQIICKKILRTKKQKEEITFLPNLRHIKEIKKARDKIEETIKGLKGKETPEIIAITIKEVLETLGKLTGENIDEKTMDQIFSRFCIGK